MALRVRTQKRYPFQLTAQFGCFRSHTQPAAKSRSQPPLLAVTGPICLFSLSFRPYLPVFAFFSPWLLTAKRSHSQHPATSHSQNPQSKPRKPAVKISLLTAIAGRCLLTGACQFGHGLGGFTTTNFIHSEYVVRRCPRL